MNFPRLTHGLKSGRRSEAAAAHGGGVDAYPVVTLPGRQRTHMQPAREL